MTKEEIGKILKRLRIASGMTQKDVAGILGRNQQIVGHWETGYSQPDANTLFLLCSIYEADINEAFGFPSKNKKEHDPQREELLLIYDRELNLKGKEQLLKQARYYKADPDYKKVPEPPAKEVSLSDDRKFAV